MKKSTCVFGADSCNWFRLLEQLPVYSERILAASTKKKAISSRLIAFAGTDSLHARLITLAKRVC